IPWDSFDLTYVVDAQLTAKGLGKVDIIAGKLPPVAEHIERWKVHGCNEPQPCERLQGRQWQALPLVDEGRSLGLCVGSLRAMTTTCGCQRDQQSWKVAFHDPSLLSFL